MTNEQAGAHQAAASDAAASDMVPRRTETGWRVGGEEVPDLTSAMVLADLIAAELPHELDAAPLAPASGAPASAAATGGAAAAGSSRRASKGSQRPHASAPDDRQRLKTAVAQLEHALSARVRVEQAIGVLAERHRLRPRQAFELLRSAARTRGRRVLEVSAEVVDSAANPLLRIPDELAKPPSARRRGRMTGHQPGSS